MTQHISGRHGQPCQSLAARLRAAARTGAVSVSLGPCYGPGGYRGIAYQARVGLVCARCYRPIEPGEAFTRRAPRGGASSVPLCRACGPVELTGTPQ